MIQRPQSIFLAAIGISMLIFLFLPIWTKSNDNTEAFAMLTSIELKYTQGQNLESKNHTFFLAILAFVSSCLAFGSLFSYKNRLKQMKINLFNHFFIIIIIILCLYYVWQGEELFEPEQKGDFKFTFFLPAAALFFNSIANRFIRKDQKIIKSVNRIR